MRAPPQVSPRGRPGQCVHTTFFIFAIVPVFFSFLDRRIHRNGFLLFFSTGIQKRPIKRLHKGCKETEPVEGDGEDDGQELSYAQDTYSLGDV